MSGRKRFMAVVGLGLITVVAAGCAGGCTGGSQGTAAGSSSAATTKLIIDITGGFAYVPDQANRTLEVAYLNDVEIKETAAGVERVVCAVDQIGTELIVVRGNIVSSSPPANRTFNLDKTVVKIPALDNVSTPLTFTRGSWPPAPAKPANVSHWQNLLYVPSLKDHHPNSGIRPNWRAEVNGRLVLKGGNIVATLPTDPSIEKADFEFRKGTSSLGSFAVTDKTIYSVDVPGTAIELLLQDSPFNYGTVRIEPTAPGQPVRLKVRGLHHPGAVSSFTTGQEIGDFCAFYSLLEPRPASSDMVKVFYNGPPGMLAGGAKPSPGFFCMGDWF